MPRYLTDKDIADFRSELCKVATERFARFGYEGVTMRQLAEALGCSPKTPYRYFKDKADILATVRAQAFGKFADALEAAAKGPAADRGRRTTEAYLNFALKNPHAYRIMFDLEAPIDEKHPELGPQAERAARHITRGADEMAKGGVIDADPAMFGYVDLGCAPRHCHAAPVGHADARTGLQEAVGLPGHDDAEGRSEEEREDDDSRASPRASASEAGRRSRPMPRAPPAACGRSASARTTAWR